MKNIKKVYEEVLKVLSKHKDVICFSYNELETKAKNHLFGVELVEEYGLKIDPKEVTMPQNDCHRFSNERFIGRYGEKYRRTVSWSDDDKQPEDEILFNLSFSTGAYIFADDYPQELFQKFFQELKSFKPDYSDSHNHCLYWKLENAKEIFNEYPNILKKHHEINKIDSKKRKIDKLQKELESLQK